MFWHKGLYALHMDQLTQVRPILNKQVRRRLVVPRERGIRQLLTGLAAHKELQAEMDCNIDYSLLATYVTIKKLVCNWWTLY